MHCTGRQPLPGGGGGGGGRGGTLDSSHENARMGAKIKTQKNSWDLQPKNVMGLLFTSKAKKETLEVHSPWGWGWGEGHGPTLHGKALGAKSSDRSYPHFKTSLTQTMSNALKHSLL